MEDFKGYALVMAPTNRIKPYSLLSLKNATEVTEAYTSIDSIFEKGGTSLPILNYEMPGNMSENIQLDLKIDADLTLFESLLKFVGSHASADFNYEKNDTINVKLTEPKSDAVENMAKIDAYINSATLVEGALTFIKDLKHDKLFMVTEILKCNNFVIENISGRQTSVQAGVAVKGMAEADAGVSSNKNITGSLSYTGEEYLTIGLKAWRIFYEKSFLNLLGKGSFRIRTSPDIKIVKGGEDYPGEQLQTSYILI